MQNFQIEFSIKKFQNTIIGKSDIVFKIWVMQYHILIFSITFAFPKYFIQNSHEGLMIKNDFEDKMAEQSSLSWNRSDSLRVCGTPQVEIWRNFILSSEYAIQCRTFCWFWIWCSFHLKLKLWWSKSLNMNSSSWCFTTIWKKNHFSQQWNNIF